jgi:lipoprotein-releasing system permease protein
MYKLLLCWRYLRTRYIALASIVSVMLGVATMIVVNSVMAGFTTEMQNRIHGILADLSFESRSLEGMRDADWHMAQIKHVAGDWIEGMTATVVVPAMLSFQYGGQWHTRQVQLIGIDETTQSSVSDFGKYLQHPDNRRQMSFRLRQRGYDTHDHQSGPEAPPRRQMQDAGWVHRRQVAQAMALREPFMRSEVAPDARSAPPPPPPAGSQGHSQPWPEESSLRARREDGGVRGDGPGAGGQGSGVRGQGPGANGGNRGPSPPIPNPQSPIPNPQSPIINHQPSIIASPPVEDSFQPATPVNPFAAARPEENRFDPAREQYTGAVLGIALASFRTPQGEDRFLLLPGDDVKLTFPTAGPKPAASSANFTLVDFYESKMSEYDASFVFVPIRQLQEFRGMYERQSDMKKVYFVNSIQIKLKPGVDGNLVRDKLRAAFPPELYGIYTWRDKQGPLLAAVQMETAILNVLLFLIIAVAGFGILAIFLMIVVEKTRDIGILKSLGASGQGVMGIFLAYGLSLGLVGSGVGLVSGLLLVKYINQIADLLGKITGRPVFDPSIYYFYKIPTLVSPVTIAWIVAGAMAIAVLASVLPALRAALLHPVEALRYE